MEQNQNNKIRIVHSWWSLPMRNGRWNKPNQIENSMYMNALSLAYAQKNGAYVVCHCDSYMKPYLEQLGYDELICDLDIIEKELSIDPVFMWAAGKFYAMQNEPLGAIHIDFDVFLTKPETVDALRFDNFDIIYSHIEDASDYQERIILREAIPTCNCDLDFAANVGIIGFNNQEAKDKYINHYLYYFHSLDFDNKGDKDLNADLLLEQTYLLQLLDEFTSTNLIGDQRINSPFDMQKNSMTIGFEHLLGRSKYEPFIIKRVKKRLEKLNKELYDKVANMKFEGF